MQSKSRGNRAKFIIGKNTSVYPLSCVRGVIPENSIYKNPKEIVIRNK